MTITIAQAYEQFKELAQDLPQDDIVMLSEEWNNYTDSLCKGGELTDLQYQHCPAYGESMPDDDREYILDAMNISMDSTSLAARRDVDPSEWGDTASHWQVKITRVSVWSVITNYSMESAHRGSVWSVITNYSMGSAHTGDPDLCDVVFSLLSDIQTDEDFQGFCDDMGYDPDDPDELRKAKRIHKAFAKIRTAMAGMFTFQETDDLNTLFEDF